MHSDIDNFPITELGRSPVTMHLVVVVVVIIIATSVITFFCIVVVVDTSWPGCGLAATPMTHTTVAPWTGGPLGLPEPLQAGGARTCPSVCPVLPAAPPPHTSGPCGLYHNPKSNADESRLLAAHLLLISAFMNRIALSDLLTKSCSKFQSENSDHSDNILSVSWHYLTGTQCRPL